MKKLLTLTLVVALSLLSFGQSMETNILPDSLSIRNGREFCSDGQIAHVLTYSTSFYSGPFFYLKIDNGEYEFINNVSYEMGNNMVYGMEVYDGDCYHLTKNEGVRIYKENGVWDSLTVNNGIHSGWTQGFLKDNNKLYVISEDTLNYFDGTVWSYYYLNTDNEYVKVKKYNNKIYFNINENTSTSTGGLYAFDGVSLELLIDKNYLYYYEIVDNQIWVSDFYEDVFTTDLMGNLINIEFDYPITSTKSILTNLNDTLYILTENTGFLIENDFLKQIQHNLSNTYLDCQKTNLYKNGILVKNLDYKLVYLQPSNYDEFGSVQLNKTYKNLDINRVDAYYMSRGQMFWDGIGTARYEVPKGSEKTSLFAGGLWLSGKDASDNIHVSASKFNSNGYDYYPGPLRMSGPLQGTTDTTYARSFDYIWKITREEILLHQILFEDPNYEIPEDITSWPAHGNVSDGYAENLAPFIDADNNGVYEPENGDYPDIKGDMSLYWIFNDNLGVHTETGGRAFGIEIHMQAYAYTCDMLNGLDSSLNYTTFLDYKIINRSDTAYHNVSSAFWTDADLGYAFDDYIGCDVGRNAMFFYNGNQSDGDGSGSTYGEFPPAQAISILDAPMAEENDGIDNDNDGTIDEIGEKALLNGMMYFNNNSGNQGDPEIAEQYYGYMNNIWKDNRPLIYGGTGYSPTGSGTLARYMFPGESDPWLNGTFGIDPNYTIPGGWTEDNESNAPADRRGIMTSGPFDFNQGDELEFTYAFVWARACNDPYCSASAYMSAVKALDYVDILTEDFNNGNLQGCGLEDVSVNEIKENNNLGIYPNPVENSFLVKGAEKNSKYLIIDMKGQIVKEGKLSSENVNIKLLKKGTYILKVISVDQISTLKLIKN